MSCDHEVANEKTRCTGKNVSYITISFVSLRASMFPKAKPRKNIEFEGKQNSLFPVGPVIKCFVIPPSSNVEKKLQRNCFLYADWLISLPRFQGAWPGHVWVESSCCCFPRELGRSDPWHVTRFLPIQKCIWVGRYNKNVATICFNSLIASIPLM